MLISDTDRMTSALVVLALDAAALRHQAIANNLANIHSAGYTPQRVNFEEQLGALRSVVGAGQVPSRDMIGDVRPFVETDSTRSTGSAATMIDLEVVKMSQNAVHYQALLKALDKRGDTVSIAINDGRK